MTGSISPVIFVAFSVVTSDSSVSIGNCPALNGMSVPLDHETCVAVSMSLGSTPAPAFPTQGVGAVWS